MKKFKILSNNFIATVSASSENTTIFNSYNIKRIAHMRNTLKSIKEYLSDEYAVNNRSIFGMINEWRVHNLLYALGIARARTKDVDLELNQPWYMKVLYFMLSPFYLHFIF